MKQLPLLLCVYNRPWCLARQIQALESIAHSIQIFVFSDGPRDSPSDRERVSNLRSLLNHSIFVDAVFNLQQTNNGCGPGMMSAINWFFSNVDSGIILEDDCILHSSAVSFFQVSLDRYRNDPRIAIISGFNPLLCHFADTSPLNKSFLSRVPITLGWASWSHKWFEHKSYAVNNTGLSVSEACAFALGGHYVPSHVFQSYIYEGFADPTRIWDYQWYLTCFSKGWLTYFPTANYVINIGLGCDATHPSSDPFLESCLHIIDTEADILPEPNFPALKCERLILRHRYHATKSTLIRIYARKIVIIRLLSDIWRTLRSNLNHSRLQKTSIRMLTK